MALANTTSTELLEGLADPANEILWSAYVDRFRPLLVHWLGRAGVPGADAQDLAQEVLVAFADAYRAGRYVRDRGRLRAWLFGFAKNRLRDWRRSAAGREQRVALGTTGLLEGVAVDDDALERSWEEDWRRAVLRRGLAEVAREVEPATRRAFERFALEGRPAADVARELGLSQNAVYGAKRRVLGRLREILPRIEEMY